MALRIKDWARTFETAKSRTYKRSNKCAMPNKIGVGLAHVLSLSDGAAIFGVFVLIAEACSTQLAPRAGYLTENGRKNGRKWTEKDISLRIRRPIDEVSRCLQVCMAPEVGWVEEYPCSIRAVSAQHPSVCIESVLSKRCIENKDPPTEGLHGAMAKPIASVPADDPVIAEYPIKGGEWPLLKSRVMGYVKLYDGLDVVGELKRAKQWCIDNPLKRKTARGMPGFLTRWLSRANDRPHSEVASPANNGDSSMTFPEHPDA